MPGACLACLPLQAVNETFVDHWAVRGDASGDHNPPNTRFPEPIYSLFAFPAEDNFAGALRSRTISDRCLR